MDIVKKNLVSIICGVVAIVALVAVFLWPLDGYFETLKEKADKRAAVQQKVNTLINKPRSVPVFDPNNLATTAKLPKFPSVSIIKLGTEAQKQVRTRSEKVYEVAWQMNAQGHDEVVPGTLPVPVSQPIALKYRAMLQEALDHLRNDELVAGAPPTQDEFTKRAEALKKELDAKLVVVDGQATNQEQIDQRYQAALLKLPGQMQQEMATKYKMYVNPLTVMKVPASIPADGHSPDKASIWWSTVAYWVTADVTAAIKEVNGSSANVTTSPVKNLLSLNIPETFFPPPGPAPVAGAEGTTSPTGGLPDATLVLPDGSAQSPTKRISNNLFDVLQFTMELDVEADRIPLFLKTLATNRFITVTRFELFPVDSQLMQITGYVYGAKPVVTLKLDCEALLMRQWTLKRMPKEVRDLLGIPDQPAAGANRGA